MEEKLLKCAEALPKPEGNFRAIEQRVEERTKRKKQPGRRRALRLALAVVLILCLATTVYAYGSMKYGLWSGIHSSSYGDMVLLNWKYDYYFPENLCGVPFMQMSTYYGAPQGATHLEALIAPTYELHNVDYGIKRQEEREDGATYEWTENQIHISFGTTEKAQWKYHFSVAEDGSCNYERVDPGSQRTVEYKGIVLHLYTIGEKYSVRWEDAEKKMVIDISCYAVEDQDAAVEIAKELIDLNS